MRHLQVHPNASVVDKHILHLEVRLDRNEMNTTWKEEV